jgi:hypothetical protein
VSFAIPFPAARSLVVLSVLVLGFLSPAHAQQVRTVEQQQDLINWYYSATFGTGVYTAGDRTVAVLQIPLSWGLRPTDDDHYGLRLKVPITFGFYDYAFDDVFEAEFPERVSTVSVMPGLEWSMPLSRRLTLKPYFSGGIGHELSGRESALIYDFGVKSRFILGEDRGVEFALVNALTAAGYRPRGGPSQPFGVVSVGLDIVIPANLTLFGRGAYFGFTPIYNYYFSKLDFAEFDEPENRIREEFELALSVLSRKPWSLKYFEVERLGVAIRSADEVFGVSLFTSLPF